MDRSLAMNEEQAANGLAALGNRTRLRLYRLLVKAGQQGLNVGEIQEHLQIPASTLAHHVATLARAGLVTQERHGREVISCVNFESMDDLIAYLTEECCGGVQAVENSAIG
jgi:DNA-binding transcriptional ArsR family regulator